MRNAGITYANTFTVRWPSICTKCQTVIGVGELAMARGYTIRHAHCPKRQRVCGLCNLQHAGDCL